MRTVSNPGTPTTRTPAPPRPGAQAATTTPGGGEAVRSWWSAVTGWRDWNLPVKLSAVILVPVVFAVVLGAITIGGQIGRADTYRGVDRLVVVNEDLRKLLTWLQRERTKAATLLTGGSRDIAFELTAERRSADDARANLVRAVDRAEFANPATTARYAAVGDQLARVDALREAVAARDVDGAAALSGYTTAIRSLLAFDRAATEEISDPGLSATAGALHDLEAAKEEVYYQQAMVTMGIARGGLTGAELDALRASQARLDAHVVEFRAVATAEQQAEFDRLMSAPGVTQRQELLRAVLAGGSGRPPVTAVDWNGASELTSGRISNVSGTLGNDIATRSGALQDQASDGAGLASVVLTVALVIAAAVIVVIGRQLLSSLTLLRREAFRVADEALPAAVERIRGGGHVPAEPEIDPVPITTADEVGAVARAFDAVHRQALKLATEQAGLRANYSDVFVNLSRRSQGLVQRQLHLLERLERDEEDADQLAVLFQLDHLATRMRRNNENLMVLSGADLARRGSRPAPLADLLRAAVSEIEQYQRVVIQPPAEVRVVGYAVGDLVRLTAELLDNAAAFSPPATQVQVTSHHAPGGAIRVEIADRGFGLSPAELAAANARIADSGTVDASTARRMGLFVVGRLAARLGARVWLERAVGQGTRAIITVPAELCATVDVLPPPPPAAPSPAPRPRPIDVPDSLPRRGANGHTNGHTNGHAANGHSAGANGTAVNGSATNGAARNGAAVNGSAVNGSRTSGAANGSAANGTVNGKGGHSLTSTPPPSSDPLAPWSLNETTLIHGPSTAELLDQLSRGATPGPLPAPRPAVEPDDRPAPLPRRTPRQPVDPPLDQTAELLFTPESAEQTGWWDTTLVHQALAEEPDHPSAPAQPETGQYETGLHGTSLHETGLHETGLHETGLHETTPIFDEMVSAWFRAVSDSQDGAWDFAADTGFRTASTVLAAEVEEFTETGLPRRTPRRNLVPGSVDPRADSLLHHRPAFARRDADDLRERLSSYQRGVHRARGLHHAGPAHGEPERIDLADDPRWRFAPDVGWRAAASVADAAPVETTADGLPRRTPRERLVPGSMDGAAAQARAAHTSGPPRDADALRSRLAGFQRGLDRGRDSLAQRVTAGPADHDGDGDA